MSKTVRIKTDADSAFARQQAASDIEESTLQGTWRLQAVEENSWLNQAELSLNGNHIAHDSTGDDSKNKTPAKQFNLNVLAGVFN